MKNTKLEFTKNDLTVEFLFNNKIDASVSDAESILDILDSRFENGERIYKISQLRRTCENSGFHSLERDKIINPLLPNSSDNYVSLQKKWKEVQLENGMIVFEWISKFNELGFDMEMITFQKLYQPCFYFESGDKLEMPVYSLSKEHIKEFSKEFKDDNPVVNNVFIIERTYVTFEAKRLIEKSKSILGDRVYPSKFERNYDSISK